MPCCVLAEWMSSCTPTVKFDKCRPTRASSVFNSKKLVLQFVHFDCHGLQIALVKRSLLQIRTCLQNCTERKCAYIGGNRPSLVVIQVTSSLTGMNPSHPGHPCGGGSRSCRSHHLHLLLAGACPAHTWLISCSTQLTLEAANKGIHG